MWTVKQFSQILKSKLSFILSHFFIFMNLDSCSISVSPFSPLSSLSPPAGSCPTNRPNSSRRCRKSPRSTSVCPWRTRSCCGSSTTVTCWRVPAASHPPLPSAHLGTLPPSPQRRPYRPDNPNQSNPFLSSDLLLLFITFTSLAKMFQMQRETSVTSVLLDIIDKLVHLE